MLRSFSIASKEPWPIVRLNKYIQIDGFFQIFLFNFFYFLRRRRIPLNVPIYLRSIECEEKGRARDGGSGAFNPIWIMSLKLSLFLILKLKLDLRTRVCEAQRISKEGQTKPLEVVLI